MSIETLVIAAVIIGALIWLIFYVLPTPQWVKVVFGIALSLVLFIFLLRILGMADFGSLKLR